MMFFNIIRNEQRAKKQEFLVYFSRIVIRLHLSNIYLDIYFKIIFVFNSYYSCFNVYFILLYNVFLRLNRKTSCLSRIHFFISRIVSSLFQYTNTFVQLKKMLSPFIIYMFCVTI